MCKFIMHTNHDKILSAFVYSLSCRSKWMMTEFSFLGELAFEVIRHVVLSLHLTLWQLLQRCIEWITIALLFTITDYSLVVFMHQTDVLLLYTLFDLFCLDRKHNDVKWKVGLTVVYSLKYHSTSTQSFPHTTV